jgi:tetratricopeptide (TPR) repeat protein
LNGFALALGLLLLQTHPGDAELQKALDALAAGDAALAEASARQALSRSLSFTPEEEIGVRPEKGLLFDEMILEARRSYRARRARYFRALGDALAGQERFREARKSYRRTMEIEPSPSILLLMAEHPDLGIAERVELLLDAYLAEAPADRAPLEARLLEAGTFRTRNALKAALDRHRFERLESSYPELELLETPFPDFQAVTNAGTLIPQRLFQAGVTLIVYVPTGACERCSEELDGITVPVIESRKRGRLLEIAAFVPERDLEVARRIARLLALPVGVGRTEGLPEAVRFSDEGEIRFVAHGGITQIRLPLAGELATAEIRRRVEAILGFLEEPGLPTESEPEDASVPLVSVPRGSRSEADGRALFEAIGVVEKLDAGPAPLADFYSELSRLTQRALADGARDIGFRALEELSRLRGANVAKTRALGAVGARLGDQVLERAQSLDPLVKRTPSGEAGVLFLSVAPPLEGRPRRLYLQRSLETDEGLRTVELVLEDSGTDLEILWASLQGRDPLGVRAVDRGAAFFFTCEEDASVDCRGVRLMDGSTIVFEGEPAVAFEGRVYRVENAIVDDVDGGPALYRPVDGEPSESSLERGLALYASSDFAAAAAAFEKAVQEIDPVAPYDAADLAYNRARALEALGRRREALEIYRSLGDVSYQNLVDERARLIESGR